MLIKTEEEIKIAIDWFRANETIVNPDKFEAIVVKRNNQFLDSYLLNIMNGNINSEASVKLLGIDIDNKLIPLGDSEFPKHRIPKREFSLEKSLFFNEKKKYKNKRS